MGKNLDETMIEEEPTIAHEEQQSTESKKKKIKKKDKHEFERKEAIRKRKLEEVQTELAAIDLKKKKKDKKKDKNKRREDKKNEAIDANEKYEEIELTHEKEKETGNGQVNGSSDDNGGGGDKIFVTGKESELAKYAKLESFAEAKLPNNVMDCCKSFTKPSPIQAHAWPFLLDGRDFIGIAKTGSGKTLAFGVPAIMHVMGKKKENFGKKGNPLCLVLSPTRELAIQIYEVISSAGEKCGVKSVVLFGGSSKRDQISALRSGVDIVIGTPGRLKDLMEMKECRLNDVSFVVLDEADRMLDLGFKEDVRSILSKTCSVRQMVMFSATWPTEVHQLAQEFMDPNPVKVVVGSEDLAANHDVMQIVEVLDEHARYDRLIALLQKYHKSQKNRVLIFALYKQETDRITNMLQRSGWKAVCIHGDRKQADRMQALELFKQGTSPLMVATDVAARGLDIPDVEVVINYSFPLTTEDYVHRIGRTGRAGKKGVAHTFFTQQNKGLAGELVNVLREAGQVVPESLLKFGTHVKKKESKLYGAHFKEIAADAPKAKKITFDDSDDE